MMPSAKNRIAFSLGMMASVASAQPNPRGNVFFGFDFVLAPIAIKWACQGSREKDLATFETLIAAFPEDAKDAELRTHIDAMQTISEGDKSLTQILGGEISKEQEEKLCDVARPLGISWLTPEQLGNRGEDGAPTEQIAAWAEQIAAWAEFWTFIESLN